MYHTCANSGHQQQHTSVIPVLGRQTQEDPWATLASPASQTGELRANKRPCLHFLVSTFMTRTPWDSLHSPHSHEHNPPPCAHLHTDTRMHTKVCADLLAFRKVTGLSCGGGCGTPVSLKGHLLQVHPGLSSHHRYFPPVTEVSQEPARTLWVDTSWEGNSGMSAESFGLSMTQRVLFPEHTCGVGGGGSSPG